MRQEMDRASVTQSLFLVLFFVLVGLQILLSYEVQLGFTLRHLGVLLVGLVLFGMYVVGLMRLHAARHRVEEAEQSLDNARGRIEELERRLHEKEHGVKSEAEVERITLLAEVVEHLRGVGSELLESYFGVVASQWGLVQGIAFTQDGSGLYRPCGTYAYYSEEGAPSFRLGETLTGQVVKEGKSLCVPDLPPDYRIITSGLGKAAPNHLFILPLRKGVGGAVYGAVELAFFRELRASDCQLIEELTDELGKRYAG